MSKKINREQAKLILKKMLSNKSLFIHCISVGLVMEEYAKKLNENKEEYFITGILHDADYEKFPNEHPHIIVKKLLSLKENKIAHAISCHYSKWNVLCKNNLDKYLLACDEITGFIVACTKVRPDGITSLKSKSVLKNLRKKSFAASVDRDEIHFGSKLIDIELGIHIDFIIEVLKKYSDILELKT
jgi:predicted hydrolase (HD superfamily)